MRVPPVLLKNAGSTSTFEQNSEKPHFYQNLRLLMCIVCHMCYDQNMLMRQLYNVLLKYHIIVDVYIYTPSTSENCTSFGDVDFFFEN